MKTPKRPWTPGPWTVPHFATDSKCGCGYVFANDGRMGAVATVGYTESVDWENYGDDPPRPEAVANARLIAAAPAMYEALEKMLSANSKMKAWELGAIKHMAVEAVKAANPEAFLEQKAEVQNA